MNSHSEALPNEEPSSKHLNTNFKDICSIWANRKTGCKVYKATHRLDGCTYAIKKVKVPEEFKTDGERSLTDYLKELQILTKFNHPNIVKYHNCWMEKEELEDNEENSKGDQDVGFQFERKSVHFLYIVMEFCTGTSLAIYIKENEVTPQKAKEMFIKILQGMKEVHSQNVIHRDLKPENIFLDKEGKKVKIGDFGLSLLHDLEADGRSDGSKSQSKEQIRPNFSAQSDSSVLNLSSQAQSGVSRESSNPFGFSEQSQSSISKDSRNRRVGTPLYCSPEQQAGREYGKETDIFALGLIFYQILGFPKATDMEKSKLFAELCNELNLESEFEARFPLEAGIIKSMAYFYPSKRAKIEEVLSKLAGAGDSSVENISNVPVVAKKPNAPVAANILKEDQKEHLGEGIFAGKGKGYIWVKAEGVKGSFEIYHGLTPDVLAGGNQNKNRRLLFKYQAKDHKGQPIDPIFVKYLD